MIRTLHSGKRSVYQGHITIIHAFIPSDSFKIHEEVSDKSKWQNRPLHNHSWKI